MIQFEIGKTYRLRGHEFLVSHRSKCYVTVHDHVINDDLKLKIRPADDGTCKTLYIRHPAGYLRADSPTEATTPETAQPATAPEYSNCNADINEAYSDAPGDNSAPMQDIPPDHVPDIAPAHDAIQPQTATTLITIPLEYEVYPTAPQITKFIIGGFYLVSHDGQYRYYMRVIARDDYSITFEDFTSGVHYSFHITIDYRISGCAENVKPDCPFARILEASASRDFVGIPAREYTRHPVFLPGKSYSAYPEIDSEIRRVSFSVNKRVKLKNDSGCCVLLRGKVSGYSFNEPVDCSVNVCRLNPSDPEDFNIGVCKFSAVSPDEDSPATPDDSP
ncbi:MAG: hypothetical protein IJG37_11500, partial [Synergistaceae bacterium]|nr:hypothetical protein [Synergistaceae bacterium]